MKPLPFYYSFQRGLPSLPELNLAPTKYCITSFHFPDVQFSRSVMSDSFRPHGLQHARPPCPSASPGVCLSSCWLHRWCCPAISSSDALFSCPQIFPSIRDFSSESTVHIRWPKYCSFSFNISPSSEYSGLISFRTVWFGLLAVQGTLRSLLQHHGLKASILRHSAFFMVQLSHPTGSWEDHSLDCMDLCWASNVSDSQPTVYVCHSFPAEKQSSPDFTAQPPSAVILSPRRGPLSPLPPLPLLFAKKWWGRCHDLSFFKIFHLKPALSLPYFTLIKRLFSSSSFSAIRVVSSAYLRLLMFLPPILIPACSSPSPAFLMTCSAFRLNKQGDGRQPSLLSSRSWTNQLFHMGSNRLLLDPHTGFSGDG